MTTLFLILHLTGAISLGAALLALIAAFIHSATEVTYVRFAKLIAALSSWQFASGLLLVVLTPNVSAWRACANMAVYWAIVFAAELAIVVRLRRQTATVRVEA